MTTLALACGAEEAPRPSGAPISGTPAQAQASADNRPPLIERVRLEPDEPIPGGRVRAVVRASDPDGGPVKLRYTWHIDGAVAGSDAPELVLDRGRKGSEVEVTVVASDGSVDSAPMRASTSIGNRRPQLSAVTLEPREGLRVGTVVKAVPEAQDPDEDALAYEVTWRVNGKPVSETGLEFDTKGLRRGDQIQAEVRASDGRVTTDAVTSPEVEIENSPPQIVSRPDIRFEDAVFHYDVRAEDPDGDRNLHYSLVSAPKGMTVDRLGGEIRWRPTLEQTGKHSVEVAVEDASGGKDVQLFEVTISIEESAPAAPAPASAEEPAAQ